VREGCVVWASDYQHSDATFTGRWRRRSPRWSVSPRRPGGRSWARTRCGSTGSARRARRRQRRTGV